MRIFSENRQGFLNQWSSFAGRTVDTVVAADTRLTRAATMRTPITVSSLALLACASLAGCAQLEDCHYDFVNKWRAKQAYCACYPLENPCTTSTDYKHGWIDGYYTVMTGGGCQPPILPPRKYWSACAQNPDGLRAKKSLVRWLARRCRRRPKPAQLPLCEPVATAGTCRRLPGRHDHRTGCPRGRHRCDPAAGPRTRVCRTRPGSAGTCGPGAHTGAHRRDIQLRSRPRSGGLPGHPQQNSSRGDTGPHRRTDDAVSARRPTTRANGHRSSGQNDR